MSNTYYRYPTPNSLYSLMINGATSGTLTLSVAAIVTDYTIKFPGAQGAAGTTLLNDGAGNLSWVTAGGITIGALDGQAANAQGLSLVSDVLYAQSADATHPGMVNNTTQTFSGAKTFTSAITESGTAPNTFKNTAAGAVGYFSVDTNAGDSTNASVLHVGNSGVGQGTVQLQYTNAVPTGATSARLSFQPRNNANTTNVDSADIIFAKTGGADTASIQLLNAGGNLTLNAAGNVTVSGSLAVTGAASASNLSGTNTGDVTLGTASGLSLAGQVLSLQLATTSLTGALSSTDWNTFNNKQAAGNYITALTGDATASGPGSVALTLATVNSNVGTFGTASSVSTVTVNAKGLVTAASNTAIQITESQVTSLVSDLALKAPLASPTFTGTTTTGPIVESGTATNTFKNTAAGTVASFSVDTNAGDSTNGAVIAVGNSGTNQGKTLLTYNNAAAAGSPSSLISFQPRNNADTTNINPANITFTKTAAADTASVAISNTNGNITLAANGNFSASGVLTAANIIDSGLTANTVVYADGSKQLTSSAVTPTQLSYVDATSSIQTQLNGKQASGNYITALTGDATAAGPGSVALTLATVNSNVGTFGTASSVSTVTVNAKGLVTAASNTAIQITESQVTSLVSDLALKAPLASPTFTGTLTAANIIDSGLTASTVPYADASKQLVSSAVTPTELGYVSGVTSAIQTQINTKAPTASPTFTGTTTTGPIVESGTATNTFKNTAAGKIADFAVDTNAGDSVNAAVIGVGNSGGGQGEILVQYTNAAAAGSPTGGLSFQPRNNANTANINPANITFTKTSGADTASIALTNTNGNLTLTAAGNVTVSGTFTSTGQLIGKGTVTNDNAAAGNIGEYSSVNSPTGGTATVAASTVFANVASVSLTAGDWDVDGVVVLSTSVTTATYMVASISQSSAAQDAVNAGGIASSSAIIASGTSYLPTGTRRLSLSGTATIYLVCAVTYSVAGTESYTASSILKARRVR